METYPNVSLDLALDGDFMINFSKDIEGWREFFTKFSDRVVCGTDTYNMYFEEDDDYEIAGRHTPIHEFFERKEPLSDWISPVEKANMARGNELAFENLVVIKEYYQK